VLRAREVMAPARGPLPAGARVVAPETPLRALMEAQAGDRALAVEHLVSFDAPAERRDDPLALIGAVLEDPVRRQEARVVQARQLPDVCEHGIEQPQDGGADRGRGRARGGSFQRVS